MTGYLYFPSAHQQPVATEFVVSLEDVPAVCPEGSFCLSHYRHAVAATEPGDELEPLVSLRHKLALKQNICSEYNTIKLTM